MSTSTVDLGDSDQKFVLAFADGFTQIVDSLSLRDCFRANHYEGEPLPDIYVNDRGYLIRTKVTTSLGPFDDVDLAVLTITIQGLGETITLTESIDGRV